MNRQDVVPLLVGHILDGAVPGEAGVVDNDIEATERFDRSAYEPIAEIGLGHVAGANRRLAAKPPDRRSGVVGRLGIEIVDHDAGTLARQFECDGPTDTPARPRYDGDLSVQLGHDLLPLYPVRPAFGVARRWRIT